MRREITFLGQQIVRLPTRAMKAKGIVFVGSTVAALQNGKVAFGGGSQAFKYGRFQHHTGLILAEGMLKLGVIKKETFDIYARLVERENAKRDARDAATEIENNARKIGLTFTKAQLHQIRKPR